ncbi:MAG TPA: YigZ family protein, partial [Thermosynergistes sp.]|nr:YigZ family protein [Thermosynergistes sp.]
LLADLKTFGVKEEDISAEYGESVKLVVPVPIGLVNEAEAMFKAYKRRFWIEGWEWLKERG